MAINTNLVKYNLLKKLKEALNIDFRIDETSTLRDNGLCIQLSIVAINRTYQISANGYSWKEVCSEMINNLFISQTKNNFIISTELHEELFQFINNSDLNS